MVENTELFLIFPWPEKVFTETCTTANHLPELDSGLDRPGKYEIHDLRDINAGIEHIYRDGNSQILIISLPLEIVYKLFSPGIIIVYHLTERSTILRIHLVK